MTLPKVVDIETSGNPWTGTLLCLGWGDQVYRGDQVPDSVWAELADPEQPVVSHSKYDARWLRLHGHTVTGPFLDTMVMAHLVNENTPLTLDYCVKTYLGVDPDKRIRQVSGEPYFKFIREERGGVTEENIPLSDFAQWFEWHGIEPDGVPCVPPGAWEQLLDYNGRDIRFTKQLFDHLKERLDAGLWSEYWEREEVPFTEVLLSMECAGVPIDLEEAADLREALQGDLLALELELLKDLSYEVNLGSGDDLARVLFSKVWHQTDKQPITGVCYGACTKGVRGEDLRRLRSVLWPEGVEGEAPVGAVDEEQTLLSELWFQIPEQVPASTRKEASSSPQWVLDALVSRAPVGAREEAEVCARPPAGGRAKARPLLTLRRTRAPREREDDGQPAGELVRASRGCAQQGTGGLCELSSPVFEPQKPGRDYVHGYWTRRGFGLKRTPVTDTGKLSTRRKDLLSLHWEHPWVVKYLEWKKLQKVITTYLDAYPKFSHEGRLHGGFNQTGTTTGRLSSSRPNLQNQPAHGPLGKAIRSLFVGDLIVGDHSQLEPRLMAHFSKDERLLAIYRDGRDLYLETALGIFGQQFDKEAPERQISKTVFLAGPSYGAGAKTVAQTLSLNGYPTDVATAEGYLEELYGYFSGLRRWQAHVKVVAKQRGYVKTLGGRYRRLKHAFDKRAAWKDKAKGERQAVNAIVQGSAADILRRNMLDCRKYDQAVRLLAQVHDELVWEDIRTGLPEGELLAVLAWTCENPGYELGVPLKFEPSFCKSWADKGGTAAQGAFVDPHAVVEAEDDEELEEAA